MDIIVAIDVDNEVVWFENSDGQGNFSSPNIISGDTDGPRYVCAADLDNDSDFDVLSASVHDDRIAWFENLETSVNVSDYHHLSNSIQIKPNPCTNHLSVDAPIDSHIIIYNYFGTELLNIHNKQKNTFEINTSDFPVGVYFIVDKQTNVMSKFVKL